MRDDKINLWHYTTLNGLEGIIYSQSLWASDYRYLNDSSEILYSKFILHQEVLPKVISILEKECRNNPKALKITDVYGGVEKTSDMETQDTLEMLYDSFLKSPNLTTLPCVLSLCTAPKEKSLLQKNGLLSQWRSYGKDGGYAVIFNMGKLCEEFENDKKQFYHGVSGHGDVVYASKECPIKSIKIKTSLDKIAGYAEKLYRYRLYKKSKEMILTDEFYALIECMMLIKHIGFLEEQEYRFYVVPILEGDKNADGFEKDDNKCFKQIMFRESSRGLVPYIKLFEKTKQLPIESICIGPHKDKASREESIKTYLRTVGQGHIKVFCSEIHFIG